MSLLPPHPYSHVSTTSSYASPQPPCNTISKTRQVPFRKGDTRPTYPKRQTHPMSEKQGSQHAVDNVIAYDGITLWRRSSQEGEREGSLQKGLRL